MCQSGNEYFAFSRRFRVARVPNSTRWYAVGRGVGKPAYVLDKIGDAATREAMQAKLDAWAARQGCRPVNLPKPEAAQMQLSGV